VKNKCLECGSIPGGIHGLCSSCQKEKIERVMSDIQEKRAERRRSRTESSPEPKTVGQTGLGDFA